jgi:hypothetical protein
MELTVLKASKVRLDRPALKARMIVQVTTTPQSA